MPELLFEIGMEEMPARFVRPALAELKALAERELGRLELAFDSARTLGTPRRLALAVSGLAAMQPDRRQEHLGPPVGAAFDADGQPTRAALGFAKSQGVEPAELAEIDTDKGPRLGVVKTLPGRPAAEVLAEALPKLAGELAFPKTMRWGSQKFRFARPIHWIVALLDGEVIPFRLAGIKSGRTTRGHRFMAPAPMELGSPAEYLDRLREAWVHADRAERKSLTEMEVETTAQVGGGRLVADPELMEEVTDLVELPVACCGSFDQEFLEVPRPVIISAMRGHQRYFALEDGEGRLLNKFIAVNNTRPRDLAVVTAGHERVLRARLADARFFLDEDLRRPLIARLDDLKQVTYHARLGTSFEKVERFTALAQLIAASLGLDDQEKGRIHKAAQLAKCDLVTEMVGEFPDLQGVIGQEYALRNGEEPEVALAVREHYLPAGAGSELPAGVIGAVVGLADRLDTICGMFAIGQKPSGAADPYGLRRAAIGIIRIITEKEMDLPLSPLLDEALRNLESWIQPAGEQSQNDKRPGAEVAKLEVFLFILDRLQAMLAEEGVPTDVAQAVVQVSRDHASKAFLNPESHTLPDKMDSLVHIRAKALALAQVKETAEFKPLAVGMKRVMNILRKEAGQVPSGPPSPERMTEEAERALYGAYQELEASSLERLAAGDYLGLLQGLSALKQPIDRFFDDVLVMDPDEKVRANRLALLKEIAAMFRQVAEFTHLQLG
jgi:glycyl-tRNA synthetase beta chain